MATNSLSNEQIARVFAMYMHCEALDIKAEPDENISKIQGIFRTGDLVDNYGNDLPLRDCKLLLTPLSAISDEDAIEVAKMSGFAWQLVEEERGYSNIVNEVFVDVEGIDRQKSHIVLPITHICFEGFVTITFKGEVFITHEDLSGQEYAPSTYFIHQYLIQNGYAVPLFIEIGHPDNGKTAIELGLAIEKTQTNS